MKKLWSKNTQEITDEIQALINNKSQIIFVNHSGTPKKARAKGMARTKSSNLLVIDYPVQIEDLSKKCLCYYHKKGCPIMGFYCTPAQQTDEYLGVNLPNQIFEIQRRKFPRVTTPNQSVASFSLMNRNRVIHGKVENVSMNGAKIYGDFPTIINKNNTVIPISLSLFQRFKHHQETPIHIPEALVARAEDNKGRTNGFGIIFDLPGNIQPVMEEYVDFRSMEDTV